MQPERLRRRLAVVQLLSTIRRRLDALGPITVVLAGCATESPGTSRLIAARPDSVLSARFPTNTSHGYAGLQTIGERIGDNTSTFHLLTDAALLPGGGVVVVDGGAQVVLTFSRAGAFERFLGGPGAANGGLIAPLLVESFDSLLAVYDRITGRVTYFDTSGTPRSSFQTGSRLLTILARGPAKTLFVGSPTGEAYRLAHIGEDGRVLRVILPGIPVDSLRDAAYVPQLGGVCFAAPSSLLYANPWSYELVSYEIGSGRVQWARAYRSDVIRPVEREGAMETEVQGAAILGLQCGPDRVFLSYLDRDRRIAYVDELSLDGSPVARSVFEHVEESPGFLSDVTATVLLGFRTRPFSRATLFELGARQR